MVSISNKACSNCNEVFPAVSKYYHKNKNNPDGLAYQCKVCRNHYNKMRQRKKASESPANTRLYQETYRKMNKDKIAVYRKEYYSRNKKKELFNSIRYNRENPEVMRETLQRYRAKKSNLKHSFTKEDWEFCLNYFNHSCAYCRISQSKTNETFHQEHVVPVSKNGPYTADNIVPSCPSCNFSKNSIDMEVWFKRQSFYDEKQLYNIIKYLSI